MESKKSIPFLSLKESNLRYAERLKRAAADVIDSGTYIGGEQVKAFERELADYLGAQFCIGVSNGLDAIRLIFRAYMELGLLKPGDEVIIPANTFIASVLPVDELGLIPVLAPVASSDMNLDLGRVGDFITSRTRAVLIVHLYGTPTWDAALFNSLKERGLLIIEDNAQSVGAIAAEEGFNGSKYAGALGDAAAISFYPTKNIGALGDGGAVVTSDEKLASVVRILANYGADRRYHNLYRGYNNRLDEIQAAFLRVKLEDLDEENDRRAAVAATYRDSITNPLVTTPEIFPDRRQVWHQYVIRTPYRNQLKKFLESNGIDTGIHYAVPPHKQPCFENRFSDESLQEAEYLCDSILSLPIANISPDDALRIASIINNFNP